MEAPASRKVILDSVENFFSERLRDPSKSRRYFLAYCLGCCLGFSAYWFSRTSPGFPLGGPSDFTTFYTGALIVRAGHPENLYDLATQASVQKSLLLPQGWVFKDGLLPYMYPPFFSVLFIPLTHLSLGIAFHIWNLVSLVLLLASIRMLLHHLHYDSARTFTFTSFVVLAFFPVFETLYKGQATFLILFFFTIVYLQLDRGREEWAGVALGFALVKPQLVLMVGVLALIQRRWRMLFAFLISAIVLTSLSVILVGLEGTRDYLSLSGSAMTWNGTYNFLPALMPNLRGTVFRIAHMYELLGGAEVTTRGMLVTTGILTVIAVCLFLFLFKGNKLLRGVAFDLQFASVLVVTLLLTPYLYGHDLSLLVLAGFIVFNALAKVGKQSRASGMVAAGHFALLLPMFIAANETYAQIVAIMLFGSLWYLWRMLNHLTPGGATKVP